MMSENSGPVNSTFEPPPQLDRRDFARSLAAGWSAVVIGGATVAQVDAAQDKAAQPQKAQDEPAAPRPPSLTTLQLAQVVTMCPGDHWDEETLAAVLNDIRGDQTRSRQLSSFGLLNHDEPALVFPPILSASVAKTLEPGDVQ